MAEFELEAEMDQMPYLVLVSIRPLSRWISSDLQAPNVSAEVEIRRVICLLSIAELQSLGTQVVDCLGSFCRDSPGTRQDHTVPNQ
jgi:hypothetical protein